MAVLLRKADSKALTPISLSKAVFSRPESTRAASWSSRGERSRVWETSSSRIRVASAGLAKLLSIAGSSTSPVSR